MNKDLTNQRFGRLIAKERHISVQSGKNLRSTWKCLCDCGTIKIIRTSALLRKKNPIKSCGCLIKQYGKKYQPGDNINLLTTCYYQKGIWTCLCQCGGFTKISTSALSSGNTKSCGCLNKAQSSLNVQKAIAKRRKFNPVIASARRVWKRYCYQDHTCVPFEQFYQISQMDCHYCGSAPFTLHNQFKSSTPFRSSKQALAQGNFIYNGLDRIDNAGTHISNNIVPCCYICNRAKNNRKVSDFNQWINQLEVKEFIPTTIKLLELPTGSLRTSINCVYYNYKQDSNLTLQEFYSLSQLPCFYCSSLPTNLFNSAKRDKKSSQVAKETGDFFYNGLDRIDSDKNHNKDNVVPCCRWCNFTKGKMSLVEFQNWIKRVISFNKGVNYEK